MARKSAEKILEDLFLLIFIIFGLKLLLEMQMNVETFPVKHKLLIDIQIMTIRRHCCHPDGKTKEFLFAQACLKMV